MQRSALNRYVPETLLIALGISAFSDYLSLARCFYICLLHGLHDEWSHHNRIYGYCTIRLHI